MSEHPSDVHLADPEPPPPTGIARSLPVWLALPAAVGLIAIVAFASRTSSSLAGSPSIETGWTIQAIEVVGYVALAIGIVLLPLVVGMFRKDRYRPAPGVNSEILELTQMPLWARILGVTAMIALLVAELGLLLAFLDELGDPGTGLPSDTLGGPDPSALGVADREVSSLAIAAVIVMALIVVLLALAIRWRLRDDRWLARRDDRMGASAAQAVDVSLEALRREPDARRAVIAAYAAMERSLSGSGLGRHRSEAPLEYLRRVLLGSTGATEEVRTITHLFQLAKFSHHEVDEPMRSGAIKALERIRAALGGSA